jgi:IclR family acetate operon transcriptional repressor
MSRTTSDSSIKFLARPQIGGERGGIQSVDRALLILDLIAESGGTASLSSIAERGGINISTCHHLISTLANWGYVSQAQGTKSYSLGSRILHLSAACLRHVGLPPLAQPFVDQINESTGEAVQLVVMQGTDLIGILRREARHAVRVDVGIGGKLNAAHATASGKAILAWISESERDRILSEKGLTSFTPKTITSREALIEELRLVRRTGFAVDREEFQKGVLCVGAVVRDHAGAVVGAISTSVPNYRATVAHVQLIRTELLKATQDLSLALGAPGQSLGEFSGGKPKIPRVKKRKLGEENVATAECQNVA